jgi:hypothetical protein
MSAGQHVQAEIHYELDIVGGPMKFATSSELLSLESGCTAIVRVVTSFGSVISREVVAIVGSATGLGTNEMMNLREFVQNGGRLRLGKGMRP